jgi:hypothetical protein
MLDDDGHFNPSGEDSRAIDPERGDSRQRDQRGRFAKDANDDDDGGDDNVGLTDEDIASREQDALEGATSDDDSGEPTDDNDGDETAITSFTELAEATEVPLEELMGLQVTVERDGEEVTLSVADLVTGHTSTQMSKVAERS